MQNCQIFLWSCGCWCCRTTSIALWMVATRKMQESELWAQYNLICKQQLWLNLATPVVLRSLRKVCSDLQFIFVLIVTSYAFPTDSLSFFVIPFCLWGLLWLKKYLLVFSMCIMGFLHKTPPVGFSFDCVGGSSPCDISPAALVVTSFHSSIAVMAVIVSKITHFLHILNVTSVLHTVSTKYIVKVS